MLKGFSKVQTRNLALFGLFSDRFSGDAREARSISWVSVRLRSFSRLRPAGVSGSGRSSVYVPALRGPGATSGLSHRARATLQMSFFGLFSGE